jgi:hypothetical protein
MRCKLIQKLKIVLYEEAMFDRNSKGINEDVYHRKCFEPESQ